MRRRGLLSGKTEIAAAAAADFGFGAQNCKGGRTLRGRFVVKQQLMVALSDAK
jgi:hypothetical protein